MYTSRNSTTITPALNPTDEHLIEIAMKAFDNIFLTQTETEHSITPKGIETLHQQGRHIEEMLANHFAGHQTLASNTNERQA